MKKEDLIIEDKELKVSSETKLDKVTEAKKPKNVEVPMVAPKHKFYRG
jgi:hypothetical protein